MAAGPSAKGPERGSLQPFPDLPGKRAADVVAAPTPARRKRSRAASTSASVVSAPTSPAMSASSTSSQV